jgi:hypothetical protein
MNTDSAPKAQHLPTAWSSAPGFMELPNMPALKARPREVEPRFQRLFTRRFEFLGDAPRWYEKAPGAKYVLGRCHRFATANPSCGGPA